MAGTEEAIFKFQNQKSYKGDRNQIGSEKKVEILRTSIHVI